MKFIGKRVLKTALAVAVCLIIYLLLMLLDTLLGVDRDTFEYAPTNWYTPFFATIATVYAMQNNPNGSISQAKIRSFGSIIGGTFGAILIFIYEFIYSKIVGESDVWNLMNNFTFKTIEFVVTTLGILLLIPLTVKLKNKNAVFISCLTYLSVTISIRNGGMNVFLFGFNRIISTIIGVLISLYINTMPHFKKRNKNILFLSTIENSLYDKNELSPFSKYMLNNFSYKGAKFSLMTTKTFASLNEKFDGVRVDTPMIVFNGSTLYNLSTNSYESLKTIDKVDRDKIEDILNNRGENYFSYVVNRGALNCYYNGLLKEGAKAYFLNKTKQSIYALEEAIPTKNVNVTMYLISDTLDNIDEILKELKVLKHSECIKYKNKDLDGDFYSLIIQPKDINKLSASKIVSERFKTDYTIAILNGTTDLCFIGNADFTLCLNNASDEIKSKVDYVLDSDNPDDLLRFIYKVFNKNNYIKYIESLTRK